MMKTMMMMMMALDMMHLMTAPGPGLMKERRMPSTRGGGVQINHAKEGKGKDKKNTTYKDKCTYTMQRIFDEREMVRIALFMSHLNQCFVPKITTT